VFVDTSSSNAWLAVHVPPIGLADALRGALRVFGPDRILFGTDSSTFPRGWRKDVLEALLGALDAVGADAAVRRKILHDNAATAFGAAGA
jgi:predicted TIM-barrel fold metal-dependent hydrolase